MGAIDGWKGVADGGEDYCIGLGGVKGCEKTPKAWHCRVPCGNMSNTETSIPNIEIRGCHSVNSQGSKYIQFTDSHLYFGNSHQL